jgi:hypothetical protein
MAEEPDERCEQVFAAVVPGRDDGVAAEVTGSSAGDEEVLEPGEERGVIATQDLEERDATFRPKRPFEQAVSRRARGQTVVAAVDTVADRFSQPAGDDAG